MILLRSLKLTLTHS